MDNTQNNWFDIETISNIEFTGEETLKLISNYKKLTSALEQSQITIENYKKFYTPNINIAYQAAEKGDLDLLKAAKENGCSIDHCTVGFSAKNGHFDCVKYMIEECKIELHSNMCTDSVIGNQIEILKYLREKECEWTKDCISTAIQFGLYDMLVYLDENECPWDKRFFQICDNEDKLKCLEYSLKKGKGNVKHSYIKNSYFDSNIKFSKEEYRKKIEPLLFNF